jgi:hypothetical protein
MMFGTPERQHVLGQKQGKTLVISRLTSGGGAQRAGEKTTRGAAPPDLTYQEAWLALPIKPLARLAQVQESISGSTRENQALCCS